MSALLLVTLLALQDSVPSYEGLTWVEGPPEASTKPRLVRWWTQG